MKITKLEQKFLNEIAESDHSSDGHGICGYPEFNNPKVDRAIIASLSRKGIIKIDTVDDRDIGGMTWVSMCPGFTEVDPTNEWSGRKFINLEV